MIHNVSLTYDDYVNGIHTLTMQEQLDLLEVIFTNVRMAMIRTTQTPVSKLAKLTPAKLVVGAPDELVDVNV